MTYTSTGTHDPDDGHEDGEAKGVEDDGEAFERGKLANALVWKRMANRTKAMVSNAPCQPWII